MTTSPGLAEGPPVLAPAATTGVEKHSIDYIPEGERHGRVTQQGVFWFLSNTQSLSVAVGFLGPALGLSSHAGVERQLAAARGPWALPAVVAAFAALAFLGAPQVVLIAAAAVVFGPWMGSLYSWIGTFVSALVGFELGRVSGGRWASALKSPGVDRFLSLLARNGLMASLLIRLAPAAPFIVVNMTAGAARVRRLDFAVGTAIVAAIAYALHTRFRGEPASPPPAAA